MAAHPHSTRPDPSEYAPYFGKYITLPSDGDILQFLESQLTDYKKLLANLSDADSLVLRAPYTWTIKQVVGHVSDCERVFGHRALWIARKHPAPLSSFDENEFMRNVDFNRFPFSEILAEFESVRRSQILLLKHLPSDAWLTRGLINQHHTTVRAVAYVLAGHAQHHLNILHNRLGRA